MSEVMILTAFGLIFIRNLILSGLYNGKNCRCIVFKYDFVVILFNIDCCLFYIV